MTQPSRPQAEAFHLKLINGNPGKRAPKNKAEAKPPLAEPTPPPHLSDDAKVEWGRVISQLVTCKLMTELDRAALAGYCQAYGRWVQAERALASMGEKDMLTRALMIKTSNGNAIQNPLVGTANKAMEMMLRAATEFGMTPSSRGRVDVGGKVPGNSFANNGNRTA